MDKNKAFTEVVNEAQKILKEHYNEFESKKIDIGDTPISPIMMDVDNTPIYFSKDVTKEYNKLIKKLEDPDSAFEYSFILLGKTAMVDSVKSYLVFYLLHCDGKDLNNRKTTKNDQVMEQYVKFANDHGYDFISLGNTHTNLSKEDMKSSIYNYLKDETKKTYNILEPGLNITLQDIISYNSFYNNIKKFYPNIRAICHTVILKNNDIKLINKTKDGYSIGNDAYLSKFKPNPNFNKDLDESKDNQKYIQEFVKLEIKKD